MKVFLMLIFCVFGCLVQASIVKPDLKVTPGKLCTSRDPDFRDYEYPEKVARCNRNIGEQEKSQVAAEYGQMPRDQWSQYEFDHLIPLCAGGSNDIQNLWPQPISQAKEKDILEVDICTRMKAGTLKQADAVQMVYDWFKQKNQTEQLAEFVSQPSLSPGQFRCSQLLPANGSSFLTVSFKSVAENEIEDLRVSIQEENSESEVISKSGPLLGKLSRAPSEPLKDFIGFHLKDQEDRFTVYLPANRKEKFQAYLKLSFEDTFPKFVKLDCAQTYSAGE